MIINWSIQSFCQKVLGFPIRRRNFKVSLQLETLRETSQTGCGEVVDLVCFLGQCRAVCVNSELLLRRCWFNRILSSSSSAAKIYANASCQLNEASAANWKFQVTYQASQSPMMLFKRFSCEFSSDSISSPSRLSQVLMRLSKPIALLRRPSPAN